MKKRLISVIFVLLLMGALMANAAAAYGSEIQPRIIGVSYVTSTLEISSRGAAKCKGTVELQSGYTADISVELQRDGSTIKSWTNSGSGTVSAGGTYYVMSGHDYVVTTSVTVRDSNNKIVSWGSQDSLEQHY